MPDLTNFPKQY